MQPSSIPVSWLAHFLRLARLLAGWFILLPGLELYSYGVPHPGYTPFSLQSPLQVDFREHAPDPALQAAVLESLQARPPGLVPGDHLAITSAYVEVDWWLGSVASLDGSDCVLQWVGSEGCTGLLLGKRDQKGRWKLGLSGTADFSRLLSETPQGFIDQEARLVLDPLTPRIAAPTGQRVVYRFPWEPGIWQYLDSWHQGAVDISATNGNRRVISAADGVVTYMCRGALSMNIGVRDADGTTVHYFHLDSSQLFPGIRVGKKAARGQALGVLRQGSWEFDGCGYANQGAGSAHLHWGLPTDRPFTADGWTITFPDPAWRRPGDSRHPGHRLKSTNVSIVNREIILDIDPPEAAGWPYFLSINDDRVERVLVDGQVEHWPEQSGCYAFWHWMTPGSHSIITWFEERGEGFPALRLTPWPAAQVQNFPCAGDPAGARTVWHSKPLEVGPNPFWELPYLIVVSDDRIRQVQLDEAVTFSPAASGCPAFWFHAAPGSHTLSYEYELRGKSWPVINIYPWPIQDVQPPDCAFPLPEPEPLDRTLSNPPSCSESPDRFEPDSDPAHAAPIASGETHLHNLADPNDQDWFRFEAQAGRAYALQASGAGGPVDTLLSIFAADEVTLLESNDDNGRSLGSRLDWTAPSGGTYYLRVRRWNPASPSCATAYWVSLHDRSLYLPMTVR